VKTRNVFRTTDTILADFSTKKLRPLDERVKRVGGAGAWGRERERERERERGRRGE
jgi:hypothetical protein